MGDPSGTVEVAHPASREHPGVFARFPRGPCGEDAPDDFEGLRIELEYIQAAEELAIWVEELVVIDFVVLAEDPLVSGLEIGLRGAPFYCVAHGVLALVRIG